jgi:hypothetical protein
MFSKSHPRCTTDDGRFVVLIKLFFMARQMGPFPIAGTFDSIITFYKTEYGLLARRKSSLDGKRVAKDPKFARTRQNAEEFRRAIQSGQLLRRVVNKWFSCIADNQVTSRMNGVMLKVLRGDREHARGERRVNSGEPALTKGFEFNRHLSLRQAMPVAYSTYFDTITGHMQIKVPGLVAGKKDSLPAGATHAKVISVGASVGFDSMVFDKSYAESACLPLRKKGAGNLVLDHQVQVVPGWSLFLWLGVVYYRLAADGCYELLKGGALSIIEAGVVNTVEQTPIEGSNDVKAETLAPALVAEVKKASSLQDIVCTRALRVFPVKKIRIQHLVRQRKLYQGCSCLKNRKTKIERSSPTPSFGERSSIRHLAAVRVEDG